MNGVSPMVVDEPTANASPPSQRVLIAHCAARDVCIVHSHRDGMACVCVGTIAAVQSRFLVVLLAGSDQLNFIPLSAITRVEVLIEPARTKPEP